MDIEQVGYRFVLLGIGDSVGIEYYLLNETSHEIERVE